MVRQDSGTGGGSSILRRMGVALVMGFVLVFAFALIMQLVADLVGWMTNTRVTFLFPLGLNNALVDIPHTINVVAGLCLASLGLAVILFWRLTAVENRASLLDIHDRNTD